MWDTRPQPDPNVRVTMIADLDLPTLRLATSAVVAATVLALLTFRHNQRLRLKSQFWSAGILAYSCAFFIIAYYNLRTSLPVNILVDLMLVGSGLLLLHGYCEIIQRPPLSRLYVVVFGLTLLESFWFNVVDDQLIVRIAWSSGMTAFVSLMSAWILAPPQGQPRQTLQFASAGLFLLQGAYNTAKLLYVLSTPAPDLDLLLASMLFTCVFVSGLSFTFILDCYRRVETDLLNLMERQQRESERRVQDAEARSLLALEYAKAGTWEMDLTTHRVRFSAQWCKMLGMPARELELGSSAASQLMHPDDVAQYHDNFQLLESGADDHIQSEHRLLCQDGNWIWVVSRGHLVRGGADGNTPMLLGADIDITEAKRTQADLELAIAEAEQARELAINADKAKSTFLANVSHEIRTPMNAIIGFSQLMMDDRDLSATQRENLEVINSSGQHLLSLIDDILNLSRLESGEYQAQSTAVDTMALFREIAQLFSRRLVKPGVEFQFQPGPALPAIIVTDQKGLRQVCINLISNALKFTEHGSVLLRVGAQPRDSDEALLQITVEDTGIGMSAAEQAVIFNAFAQTRYGSAQATEGVGLGLYICKNIVARLGGRIDVSSAPGQGSRFTVTLPVGLPGADTAEPATNQHVSGLQLGRGTQRVLIVDDIESNRKLLRRLLHDSGLHLYEAASADTALALVKQLRPHLVLMDIRMPGKSGDAAIAEIRQLADCATLPIIAVTANAMEGERERLLELGATDFITKPFQRDEIYRKIAGVLQLELSHRKPATTARSLELQPRPVLAAASSQQAPSILVVDDNQANLQLLCSQLKALGLSADVADDGESGLRCWRERRHALLFVDCAMPHMSGFEMTRQLRALERQTDVSDAPRSCVIAITGSPEEYQQECLAAGMDAVLGKPLLLNTLKDSIRQHHPAWLQPRDA